MNNTKKQNFWVRKIETKEDALQVINEASIGFVIIGGLQIAAGLFLGMASAIDGIVYTILALILRGFKSRIAAVLLLLLSLSAIVATGMNLITGSPGGRNMFLAVFVAATSIKAIQATFKYNKTDDTDEIASIIQ